MSESLTPFSCVFKPSIPELLQELQCTIAISTYQAGKIIFISASDQNKLVQLPRNFDKAMGISIHEDKLALAVRDKVHLFANSSQLAAKYPIQENKYDALYMPRKTYYTGKVDIHDIHIGKKDIFCVNTSFSCVAKMSDTYSWEPIWKPEQITALASEDRCHLNGLIVDENDELDMVTALGNGDSFQSWRKNIPNGGMLYDVKNGKTLLSNLRMPHSPRKYANRYFLLESAEGLVQEFDQKTNKLITIKKLPAFVRGLAIYKDFLFVGKSKIRTTSSIFGKLEIAKHDIKPGITIIHLPSQAVVGEINYLNSLEEIYDVQIIPNLTRPNIINPESDIAFKGISIPNSTFWSK
ncbi:TIGR03032 family protein [Portibacter lacus]|uniref:TIGR03032 family protein n=1 Tax=Portibacter lacus TaxID=1099794 RepID=A0AA37SMY3_9BACT|nr:TIGR03032 family protein [Portibacter lacus]GLR16690.1 TIGR03032 family protein [Portibacter lacus]